ncbi:MAG TPA: 30S ribosomal protein S5 [Candidatus Paceibacterota bacterium]|nr:30S ribosomal protein S5 [Candidatus Paceibacterota bacterium]
MTSPVEKETIQEIQAPETAAGQSTAPITGEAVPEAHAPSFRSGRGSIRGRGQRTPGRMRMPRERSEFDQVTLDARRVARVMAGGRRFNFSIVVVIGDRKGRVGVGLGKGADTALAIDKAVRDAKKHLITVTRTATGSIPHQVHDKYSASIVEIMPSSGRGLVAGSAVRTVLDLAGVTDVVTKIHSRTKNKLTMARATVNALKKLRAK